MQVDDNVEVTSRSPANDLVQLLNTSTWEVFTVSIYEIFLHPVAHRYPNTVQANSLHLIEAVLGDPSSPTVPERLVRGILSQQTDAVELGTTVSIPPVLLFPFCHPFLDFE